MPLVEIEERNSEEIKNTSSTLHSIRPYRGAEVPLKEMQYDLSNKISD